MLFERSARNAGDGVAPGSTVWFVPADFLSDAQVAAYGRFAGVPSRSELERFFFLDGRGLELIAGRRGDHSRLGLAVQIGTVRYLGRFLEDPLDVPWPVVEYLAGQLGIADASCVKAYTDRLKTAYEHAWEIRRAYGYRPFEDVEATASFRAFLEGRAWTHAEGPAALFAQAVSWLRRERVLLPGVSVLTRLVSQVRDAAAARLYVMLSEAATSADPMLPARLHGLLQVSDRARFSELERLRRSPRRNSGPEMVRALDRVNELAGIGAGAVDVTTVPANRLAALARYGLGSKAAAVGELAEPRRTATLVAVARYLEATAVDDALDVFDQLMATRLISPARRASQAGRLAALPRLEKASRMLARAHHAIEGVLAAAEDRGGGLDVTAVWEAVEHVAPWEQVAASAAVVDELVPDDNDGADAAMRAQLADRYRTVRPFLELLGASPVLGAAAAGRRVLAAVRALPELSRRRVRRHPLSPPGIDQTIVPPAWSRAVHGNTDLPAGAVDRDAYVVCVLEQLHKALRVRDIFAAPSLRWGDPRARLLAGRQWEGMRDQVLTGLGLTTPVEQHLAAKAAALDAAWQQMAARLAEAGDDTRLRVVPGKGGRMRLSVERLHALGDPPSLADLRERTAAMLPLIDLPDLLLEVHAWTGFLDQYTHLGALGPRMDDLPVSVAALLVAEACNIGLTPVTSPDNPALTRDRLSHVDQNYLRADTHAAANALLIEAQARVPLARAWGGGLLASVDGLRFVVPVRTLNAGPSPKYFGYRRGLTWLNAVNDQVAGIGATVVPGTPRDSLYILDTLLNLDAGPKPEVIATDEASYSDMVFGVFALLGYRFSPRIADMGDQRFWRATPPGTPAGDYGALNAIARNKVNLGKIRQHWPDMLRVAGSLVTGTVRAYDVLRMLGRHGHPSPLGQAFAEYGRIDKTLHLLAMIDPVDDTHRRTVHAQTTVQESRHQLGRKIFHGRRGQIYQAYREGQEDQLGALGLVLNAVVLWNTVYLDAALARLRDQGYPVRDEDVARLSPLGHAHLNCLGRYTFTTSAPTAALRPLRDPDSAGDTGKA